MLGSRPWRWLRRLLPLTFSLALLFTVLWSSVPLSLFAFSGLIADAVAIGYAALLAFWTKWPDKLPKIHPFGAALAILLVTSRAGGFISLMLERESISLLGAVFERAFIGLALVAYHWRAAFDADSAERTS